MLSWVAISFLVFGAAETPPKPTWELCEDRSSECKETCSMEFGTDPNMRTKLGACLITCKQELRECRAEVGPKPDAGFRYVAPNTATSSPR